MKDLGITKVTDLTQLKVMEKHNTQVENRDKIRHKAVLTGSLLPFLSLLGKLGADFLRHSMGAFFKTYFPALNTQGFCCAERE